MVQEAAFDKFIFLKWAVDFLVRNQPASTPRQTIVNGRIFICPGKIDSSWFIGMTHSNAAPHVIDIKDIRIIGVTTFGLSNTLPPGQ